MSIVNEVRCDQCSKFGEMTYNGEHWLTPEGWTMLWNPLTCVVEDNVHLCNGCSGSLIRKAEEHAKTAGR